MSTITATVKFKAMNTQTRHGQRANVVIRFPDGQEGKIWGEPDDAQLFGLHKGQTVLVEQSGNSYRLSQEPAPAAGPGEAAPQGEGKPERDQIEKYIRAHARLFRLCFETVAAEMQEFNLSSENLRAIANGLHITVRRKFDL